MIKIVCWNIAKRIAPWDELKSMRDKEGVDIALLQEVGPSAAEQMKGALGGNAHWDNHPDWSKRHGWPAVLKLSARVEVEWFRPVSLMAPEEKEGEIAVSDLPTLAAARVTPSPKGEGSIEPFIVVSMYARWYRPHPLAREAPIIKKPGCDVIEEFADASAHRIISDLSGFIAHTNPANHRIIAAGDLNTIYGAVEGSELETPIRAQTVFDRMSAIGMEFVGPQWPDAARQADPPSVDVPTDTRNVPTFHTNRQTPETAKNQLDYVFVSRGFHERVSVRALNDPDEWGPSDHCRIVIDVGQGRAAD